MSDSSRYPLAREETLNSFPAWSIRILRLQRRSSQTLLGCLVRLYTGLLAEYYIRSQISTSLNYFCSNKQPQGCSTCAAQVVCFCCLSCEHNLTLERGLIHRRSSVIFVGFLSRGLLTRKCRCDRLCLSVTGNMGSLLFHVRGALATIKQETKKSFFPKANALLVGSCFLRAFRG